MGLFDIRLRLATLQLLSFRGLAPGAMLHSDRGSIYTAQLRLRENHGQPGLGNYKGIRTAVP